MIRSVRAMATASDYVWKFGYGSNLSPSNLDAKKGIKVIEYSPAYIPDYTLAFHNGGSIVEPAYATACTIDSYLTLAKNNIQKKDDPIWYPLESRLPLHGVASKITRESQNRLDAQEGGDKFYDKKFVIAKKYDGTEIEVEIYVSKFPIEGRAASRRYLNLMINGAKEIGIDEEYIKFLESIPCNVPTFEQLERRKKLPNPKDSKKLTIEELSKHNGKNKEEYPTYKSAVGYIVIILFSK